MRKYEELWCRLKADKAIGVSVIGFNAKNLKRDISTLVRGIQKEKYQDIPFRVKNQGAIIEHSTCDLATDIVDSKRTEVIVTFTLHIAPTEEDFQ